MLVNPKLISYSDFYIHALDTSKDDGDGYSLVKHYNRLNYYAAENLLPKKVGFFGLIDENMLHPMYYCDRQQWHDIHITKIASRLKRNRYLSNRTKNGKWNDNYRSLFNKRYLFERDFESYEAYEKACDTNKDVSVTTYGAGDSPEQIYNRLNFLNLVKDQDFFISLRYIHKEKLEEGESSYGGYRQHKNGGYYGTKNLQREYLADEDDIEDGIYQFHIYKLNKIQREIIRKNDFIFCRTDANRDHHTIFDANDESKLICYLFKDSDTGMLEVGHGSKTILKYDFVDGVIPYDQINDDLKKLVDDFHETYVPDESEVA